MLLLLQLAIAIAFLGYLILALFDAVRGGFTILTGLALLAFSLTLKGILVIIKQIHPAPVPVVAPAPEGREWRIVP